MEDQKVDDILREYSQLSGDRGVWETHWDEIAQRVLPSYSGLFTSGGFRTPGEKRTAELYDSTAAIALNRFASILDSLLTPRNQTWHRIQASDPVLNKDREVKLWFEEVNRVLFKFRYAPNANFSSQNQHNYKSLGAFGTGCVFVDALKGEPGLRYRNIHLGEIFFSENHQGIVDKALRGFKMTARQAVQKFGDKCPDKIKEAAKKPETCNKEYEFIHCVKPNEDRDVKRADYKGMPFASYYVAKEDKKIVGEGGFSTFPYAISRYEQSPGEVYGRSPAMDVLPAIKTLNEQKKTVLQQGHRAVAPVLLSHDDGVADTFSWKPGALNAGGVSADGRALIQALPVGNIAIGKDLMDDERAVINDAFLVNIFQILVETPQMTATEVMERTKEKGILLAPTIGRQQSEYLGPMIERELDLLTKQFDGNGRPLLPPMPQALLEAKGEYRVEYDSPLSRAQRAEEASGLMRTLESTLQVVNITGNPAPLDHFNWDVVIPAVADIHAVPAKWLRSMEEVQSIREGRAAEAQQQQMMQAAPGAAALIKANSVAQKNAPARR